MGYLTKVSAPVGIRVGQEAQGFYLGSCKNVRSFPAIWKTELKCDFDIELEKNAEYRAIIHCSDVVRERDVDPMRERFKKALGDLKCEIISTRVAKNSNMIVLTFKYVGNPISIAAAIVAMAIAAVLLGFMLTVKSSSWEKLFSAPTKPLREASKFSAWVVVGIIAGITIPMFLRRGAGRLSFPKPKR